MQYKITGENMPVLIFELENGEYVISQNGAMSWMSPNMEMETSAGGIGKAFGRMFTGESMFRNIYTSRGNGMIAFSSTFPGHIAAVEVGPGKSVVAQKSAFLACTGGVEMGVFFQKKIGAALLGGEGFIMQQFSGNGIVFLEIDGSSIEYELAAGQQLVVSTGSLAMVDASCSIDIVSVKGLKNALLGGEGLFNTVVTGPGRVTLQTMPKSALIGAITAHLPAAK